MAGRSSTDGRDSLPDRDSQPLEERPLNNIEHLRELFYTHPCEFAGPEPRLDYHALGGPGLERLCFHLLLAEGRSPRFFGNPGQAQYGIDLIVADGKQCTVYQCKNVATFDRPAFKKALGVFAKDWLTDQLHLTIPDRFVLCCPLDLRERSANENWQELIDEFARDHDVAVEIWHREILDGRLRHQPDVVADLFSPRIAELFCRLDDWNEGLFRPVRANSGERRAIERYLELQAADRIVREDKVAAQFAEILGTHKLLLVLGASGSGKTITTLDLSKTLAGGAWRVFFVSLRHQTSDDNLVAGIKRRSMRPTIFVLDDCHLDFDLVERVTERLLPLLGDRPIRLALTAQAHPEEPEALRGSVVDFVDSCEDAGQVLWLAPTVEQYAAIVAQAVPVLRGLSQPRLERLYEATAHDLILLDAVLEDLSDPAEVDALEEEALYRMALRRYFGGDSVHAPNLKRLAAVAQFDLAIPQAELPQPVEPGRQQAVGRLTVATGRPPSLSFVHASAAELVFRALCWIDADSSWLEVARQHIVDFFLASIDNHRQWDRELHQFLRGRLRLADDLSLKQAVLADSALLERLAAQQRSIPLPTLSLMTFLARGVPVSLPYATWLSDAIEQLVLTPEVADHGSIGLIGLALRNLGLLGGGFLEDLEAKVGPERMLRLLEARGTLLELFRTLQYSTSAFAAKLLDALDPAQVEHLIGRTIAEGRSIGTLNLALRELGSRPLADGSGLTQLEALEAKLGAQPMMRLLKARGTLLELFKTLEHSTPAFAAELVEALNPARVEHLIGRTIAEGRSIGTLHLALRELGSRPLADGSGLTQLEALEVKLGAQPMMRLIEARGTLFELFKTLEHSTPAFAAELVEALNPAQVEHLIGRTIAEGRSIGTLNLALRKLRRTIPPSHARLETLVGLQGWWRLVCSNGDLNDLAYILGDLSEGFRSRLLSPAEAPSVEEWGTVIRRGSFYDLCRFARDGTGYLPAETLRRAREAAAKAAAVTFDIGDWLAVNTGLQILPEIEDAPFRATLRVEADHFLEDVSVSSLAFEGFSPAVNAIACLWRERPQLRPELASRFWSILPAPHDWPEDERFLVAARLLLILARSTDLPQKDAVAVLKAFCPLPESLPLDKTHTRPMCFFWWDLFALWFERGHELARRFGDLETPTVWTHLIDLVKQRAEERMSNEKKLDLLAFAGVLAFLLPELRPAVRAAVVGRVRGVRYLQKAAEALTFVPAFFALHGLSLLCPPAANFTSARCARLLQSASEYEARGPAIDYLCADVRKRARTS